MATTLSSLLTRVRDLLMDSGAVTWKDANLTEAVRLALGEYNLLAGSAVTVDGLDGALATTLPLAHESLLVVGAAGYAAAGRSLDEVERIGLGETTAEQVKTWADVRLGEFRGWLEGIRRGGLRGSVNATWGTLPESGGIEYGEGYDRS